VVVGDDHVDAEPPRLLHLGGRGDAAVDREDQLHALGRKAFDRGGGDAVALLEAARQCQPTSIPSSRSVSTASAVAQIPSTS
jgi:hypothetical protein